VIRIETAEQGQALLARLRELEGKELAAEVMELVEDNLERWRQGAWRSELNGTETAVEEFVDNPLDPACTTAFCFAGWIGAVHRVKWAADLLGYASDDTIGDPATCDCTGKFCDDTDHQLPIQDYATRVLGLTDYAGIALFSGDNSLKALQAGVAAIQRGQHGSSVAAAVTEAKESELDDFKNEQGYADSVGY
jgi:hypothetical protein